MAWHLGRRAKDEWHDTCARDTAAAFRYVMRLQPGMAQSGTKPKATPFAAGQRGGAQATAASLGLHATGPPVPQTHAKTPILPLHPTADSKTTADTKPKATLYRAGQTQNRPNRRPKVQDDPLWQLCWRLRNDSKLDVADINQ